MSATSIDVGLMGVPDEATFRVMRPLFSQVDRLLLTPETLWRPGKGGSIQPNDFHRLYRDLQQAEGLPCAAHGVGLSVGSGCAERLARWIDALAADHEVFHFDWFTDHAGLTEVAGELVSLPVPLPSLPGAADASRSRLAQLTHLFPFVGVESTADTLGGGDPMAAARLLRHTTADPFVLLLDLHNVYTMAENFGFSALEWIDELDLSRVIEIHLSGGSVSAPGLLPSGRQLRLDSHDQAVPEPVWDLLTAVLPRCPHLQAVTLERLDNTVEPQDVPLLADELGRIRDAVAGIHTTLPPRGNVPATMPSPSWLSEWEAWLAPTLRGAQAPSVTDRQLHSFIEGLDSDSIDLSAVLVLRLRFERLLQGSSEAGAWFETDPGSFAREVRRFHRATPLTATFPAEEADLFLRWCAAEEASAQHSLGEPGA